MICSGVPAEYCRFGILLKDRMICFDRLEHGEELKHTIHLHHGVNEGQVSVHDEEYTPDGNWIRPYIRDLGDFNGLGSYNEQRGRRTSRSNVNI